MRSLCGVHTVDIPSLSRRGGRPSNSGINVDHRLERMGSMHQCVYCNIVHKVNHRTTRKCRECQVPLCFRSRDCFTNWHHRNFTKQREAWFAAPKQPTSRGRPKGSVKPKGRGKRLTCIKEWISLIAMLSYTVFVTVYIQASWFSSSILMFIEQVHLLLLFTSKSRPWLRPHPVLQACQRTPFRDIYCLRRRLRRPSSGLKLRT